MKSRSSCFHGTHLLRGEIAVSTPLRAAARRHGTGARNGLRHAAVLRSVRRNARRRSLTYGCNEARTPAEIVRTTWASGKRFLMVMLFSSALADAAAAERHPAGLACGSCHVAAEPDPSNASQLLADEAALCASCHRNALYASHPIGIQPGFATPAALPLSARGEITCSTCHQTHGETPKKLRSGLDGQSLCASCHEADFFDGMRDDGLSLMALGHLDAGAPLTGNIDNFSIQCLACHENSADVFHQQAAGIEADLKDAKANHPIGRRYTDSINFGGYRPAHRLPSSILLPDGKLSCLSCHVGYSDSHGALVIENRASNLCSACHSL